MSEKWPKSEAPCSACGKYGGMVAHRVLAVPVSSCLKVNSQVEAREVSRGDLRVVLCETCGYLGNRSFVESLVAYDERYEDSQAFSPTFTEYAQGLARRWIETHKLQGKTVVEVGTGRGDFARQLIDEGVGRVIAVDPSLDPERFGDTRRGRIELRKEWFGPTTEVSGFAAIVSRHVLEHVAKPVAMLRAMRQVAALGEDVAVLTEVPDATRILREGAFWDLFYEHSGYFVPSVLEAMYASAGLEIVNNELVFEDQYLLIDAKVKPTWKPTVPSMSDRNRLKRDVQNFRESVAQKVSVWKTKLESCKSRGFDVVLWGSGSKSTAFLSLLRDDSTACDAVSRVVDINPHKQGTFMLGSGIPIVGPDDLVESPPALVVVMNPIYTDEIKRALGDLGLQPEVEALK